MANVEAAPAPTSQATPASSLGLLVSLSSGSADHLALTLSVLGEAFAGDSLLVTSPDINTADETTWPGITLLPLGEHAFVPGSWLLTPAELLGAFRQSITHNAVGCLLLGPEAYTLSPQALRALAQSVLSDGADLGVPNYALSPREGLVNSAMLYPVSRALYNAQPRYPLALDLAFSRRFADRLAPAATRAAAQTDALLWPVAEASVAGMRITQVSAGSRALPTPGATDLNTVLAQIAGSLFADIEAKAAFWQRSRPSQGPLTSESVPPTIEEPVEVQSLIEGFRVANTNLRDIWSLVLPPQSLLGLKKLSVMDGPSFRMPTALWARIVYDFVLAFRLRTLNRGHLLGALTPLYLAWVASHLLATSSGMPSEHHVEETAAAFESEKPYFVSRWRWPDRFNP